MDFSTTYNDGFLGSGNDEERSEMRYCMTTCDFQRIRVNLECILCLRLPAGMFNSESYHIPSVGNRLPGRSEVQSIGTKGEFEG